MTSKKDSEKIKTAFDQLLLEQSWVEASRSVFGVRPIDDYLQLAFAENVNTDDSIDIIRQFTLLVEKGITPPAVILSAIASSFRVYMQQDPFDSLDYAFNLKRKQSVGHPLKHRSSKEKRGRIVYLIWCLRHKAKLENKILSIENAAGELINQMNLDLTEDALKKDYITMNADEVFDKALKALALVGETIPIF